MSAREELEAWVWSIAGHGAVVGCDIDSDLNRLLDALVAEAKAEALKELEPTMWLCHYPGGMDGESFWYDDRSYALDFVDPGTVYRVERAMRLPDVFVVVRRNPVSDDDETLEFPTEAEAHRCLT